DLAFYDVEEHRWKIEAGEFKILSGTSARDIHQEIDIKFVEKS
ncbi:MAG: fibronectin type III-like domain-contianing protein, partial [Candidatus Thorarchaeota archaeon]